MIVGTGALKSLLYFKLFYDSVNCVDAGGMCGREHMEKPRGAPSNTLKQYLCAARYESTYPSIDTLWQDWSVWKGLGGFILSSCQFSVELKESGKDKTVRMNRGEGERCIKYVKHNFHFLLVAFFYLRVVAVSLSIKSRKTRLLMFILKRMQLQAVFLKKKASKFCKSSTNMIN